MARVLVIEDDAAINDVVATRLSRDGHMVTQAFSGSEARLLLGEKDAAYDLVISDLMLPGATGEELVGLIRERNDAMPVIVISARTTPSDKVDLLRLGADDYLTKPFDLDELAVRVEVQLRHRGDVAPADEVLRWRRWALDPQARTLTVAPGEAGEKGGAVSLTRIEFNILEALVRRPNRVFSKSSWRGASPLPEMTPRSPCMSPTFAPSCARPVRTTTSRPSGAWVSSSHDPNGVCPQ